MKRLVVATSNPGKLREFAEALIPVGIELFGLDALGVATPVEETGNTFEENARHKAEEYSRRTDLPVLADDSGLEVDGLAGAPGVESARWGGPDLDDPGRCRKLLQALGTADRRNARFRCVLAIARGGTTLATFTGTVEGQIASEPSGNNGFGYDPVFLHPESGRTFAELSTAAKRAVSHRGLALSTLLEALRTGDPRLG